MGKYIITFEDYPQMEEDGVKFYSCNEAPWWYASEQIISKLTPYTEPDLNAIKQEEYEKGYKTAKVQCNIQAEKDLREVGERHYQKGLSDAWDAARKISRMDTSQHIDVFDIWYTQTIIESLSASEVIEKIRQYEQKQENGKMKAGDEVQHKNCNDIKIMVLEEFGGVITGIALADVYCSCKVGDMYINRDAKDWEKTGKHYEIAEVLKKIQGGSDG